MEKEGSFGINEPDPRSFPIVFVVILGNVTEEDLTPLIPSLLSFKEHKYSRRRTSINDGFELS